MKKIVLFALLVAFSVIARADISVDTFARIPLAKGIQISPDGGQIAYMRDVKGEYVLVVQSLINPKIKPKTLKIEGANIRSVEWITANRLIFSSSQPFYSRGDFEKFTMWRTGLFDTDNGETIYAFNSERFKYNIGAPQMVSKLPSDPNHILMSYYYTLADSSKTIHAVFKVNIQNGKRKTVMKEKDIYTWIADSNEQIGIYQKYSDKTSALSSYFLDPKSGDYEVLSVIDENGKKKDAEKQFIGLAPDRKALYYFAENNEKRYALFKADINNFIVENDRQLSAASNYDVDTYSKDLYSGIVDGYTIVTDHSETTYFDPTLAQVQADLVATFPDTSIDITSYDKKKIKFVAKLSSDEFAEQYVLYDTSAGTLGLLGQGYPLPAGMQLSPVERFDYKAKDGLALSGYLTLPIAQSEGKPKLIVMPHGGPASRDTKEFDWMRQFFASKGYAVFQPNFRGSEGFGSEFEELGHGQWGQNMQTDVDDGVSALIKKGLVDESKICIVGASYGGYVAMYAAASQPERYRCAVSFAGVSELSNMFYHAEQQKGGISYWSKSIGNKSDLEFLRQYSPLDMATKNIAPLLMIHGEDDTVVPSFQSSKMYTRLKELKVDTVQYIELEEADHWLSTGNSRKVLAENAIAFIEKHM